MLVTCAYLVDSSSPWVLQSLFLAAIGEARDRGSSCVEAFAYRYVEGETAHARFQEHRTIFPADFLADFGFRVVRTSGRVGLARLELGGLVPVEEGKRQRVLRVVKEAFLPDPRAGAALLERGLRRRSSELWFIANRAVVHLDGAPTPRVPATWWRSPAAAATCRRCTSTTSTTRRSTSSRGGSRCICRDRASSSAGRVVPRAAGDPARLPRRERRGALARRRQPCGLRRLRPRGERRGDRRRLPAGKPRAGYRAGGRGSRALRHRAAGPSRNAAGVRGHDGRRDGGEAPRRRDARRGQTATAAPAAASRKKWFPVATITSSTNRGYTAPAMRTMRRRARRATVTPMSSAKPMCMLGTAAYGL